jgi:hypothetical protein
MESDCCVFYFEIDVLFGGAYDQLALGMTADQEYPYNQYAGYKQGSIGYHSDDGSVFLNGKLIKHLPRYGTDDVVGCGVTASGNVFFSINGFPMEPIKAHLTGLVSPILSLRGKMTKVAVTQINKCSQAVRQEASKYYFNSLALRLNPNEEEYDTQLIESIVKENPHDIVQNILSLKDSDIPFECLPIK